MSVITHKQRDVNTKPTAAAVQLDVPVAGNSNNRIDQVFFKTMFCELSPPQEGGIFDKKNEMGGGFVRIRLIFGAKSTSRALFSGRGMH